MDIKLCKTWRITWPFDVCKNKSCAGTRMKQAKGRLTVRCLELAKRTTRSVVSHLVLYNKTYCSKGDLICLRDRKTRDRTIGIKKGSRWRDDTWKTGPSPLPRGTRAKQNTSSSCRKRREKRGDGPRPIKTRTRLVRALHNEEDPRPVQTIANFPSNRLLLLTGILHSLQNINNHFIQHYFFKQRLLYEYLLEKLVSWFIFLSSVTWTQQMGL